MFDVVQRNWAETRSTAVIIRSREDKPVVTSRRSRNSFTVVPVFASRKWQLIETIGLLACWLAERCIRVTEMLSEDYQRRGTGPMTAAMIQPTAVHLNESETAAVIAAVMTVRREIGLLLLLLLSRASSRRWWWRWWWYMKMVGDQNTGGQGGARAIRPARGSNTSPPPLTPTRSRWRTWSMPAGHCLQRLTPRLTKSAAARQAASRSRSLQSVDTFSRTGRWWQRKIASAKTAATDASRPSVRPSRYNSRCWEEDSCVGGSTAWQTGNRGPRSTDTPPRATPKDASYEFVGERRNQRNKSRRRDCQERGARTVAAPFHCRVAADVAAVDLAASVRMRYCCCCCCF